MSSRQDKSKKKRIGKNEGAGVESATLEVLRDGTPQPSGDFIGSVEMCLVLRLSMNAENTGAGTLLLRPRSKQAAVVANRRLS